MIETIMDSERLIYDDMKSEADTLLYDGAHVSRLKVLLVLLNMQVKFGWSDTSVTALFRVQTSGYRACVTCGPRLNAHQAPSLNKQIYEGHQAHLPKNHELWNGFLEREPPRMSAQAWLEQKEMCDDAKVFPFVVVFIVAGNETGFKMRPIFCGNFEYDARESEVERLFEKYGKVDRVDMKAGFAFVYMEDEADANDAIRGLDNLEFGQQKRLLRVEWAKPTDGPSRKRAERRRDMSSVPAKTLFVINFDPASTSVRDLENHFEPYGELIRVHIHKNFAFVEYGSQEAATTALERTHKSKVLGREITVEYAVRENGDPSERRSGRRSPEPRGSYRSRRSPGYRRGSPVYDRYQSRSSPRRYRSRSPDYRPYTKS
ncbi:hypothetical protein L7F22_057488 [Adiantum nelumboides]|nr:hypothetical protein [Adiantum nelumboides]